MTSPNNSCQAPLKIHESDAQPTFRNTSSSDERPLTAAEKGCFYFSSPLGRHPTVSRRGERILPEEGGEQVKQQAELIAAQKAIIQELQSQIGQLMSFQQSERQSIRSHHKEQSNTILIQDFNPSPP